MYTSLSGRTYIVSGGASGIGLATVRRLLSLSATVHAVDRSSFPSLSPPSSSNLPPSSSPAPENEAGGRQGRLFTYPGVDVSSRAAITEAFKAIFHQSPRVHGLVNAAGVSPSGSYEISGPAWAVETDDIYDFCMEVNSRGSWNMFNELLRSTMPPGDGSQGVEESSHLGNNGKMSVVNIGSIASVSGVKTMAAYTASKHAALGLTRTWALEHAARGIRVNMVLPGLIKTPLGLSASETSDERGDVTKIFTEAIPMKRMGEPEEVTGAIVYLLSDESSYITGEAIKVSGGS